MKCVEEEFQIRQCAKVNLSWRYALQSFRVLADLVAVERQCVATMVILVWVKLMDPLQGVFQDFFLLVKMIALMIGIVGVPGC